MAFAFGDQTPAPQQPPQPTSGGFVFASSQPQPVASPQPQQRSGFTFGEPMGGGSSTLQGLGHLASQVLTPVGKLLDAQRYGVARLLTGKENTDDQMTSIRHAIPGVDQLYEASGKVPIAGHFLQGAEDTAIQTAMDPLTYETMGAGPLLKGLGIAGKVGPTALRAMNATPLGRVVYDFMHWGGKVNRTLGTEVGQTVRGATNMASSTGSIVQRDLLRRFDEVEKGLNPQEKVRVGQALNGEIASNVGAQQTLSPTEKKAYDTLRQLTEEDYAHRILTARTVALRSYGQGLSDADRSELQKSVLGGQDPVIPKPEKRVRVANPDFTPGSGKPKYTNMPANQVDIARMTEIKRRYDTIERLVEDKVPKREHYMPWAHEPGPQGREGFTANMADYHDPRNVEREEVHVTTPDQLRRGFEAMASNTNRQVTTRLIHESLNDLLDNPEIKSLMDKTIKATGGARTDTEKIKDAWLGLVGYPRAAIVSLTPRHGANILDLLVNTVPPQHAPQVLKDTMALALQLVKASPEEYDRLTQEGRQLGAISGSFNERKPFFQNVPGLRNWTALNNKLTWAIDEAAKQTYAKLMVKTGEAKGLQAGGLASQRLVDYEHLSPLQNALRYIAPFGTFRGGIPGAVVGGIARNPARAALLNRASGGTMYGGQPAPGQPGMTLYNPTADIGRVSDYGKTGGARSRFIDSGVANFARGTIGAPVQAILNAAQDVIGQPGHWASHGQGWLPKKDKNGQIDPGFIIDSAIAGVPEAQTILEMAGIGRFKYQGMTKEALRQALGIGIR